MTDLPNRFDRRGFLAALAAIIPGLAALQGCDGSKPDTKRPKPKTIPIPPVDAKIGKDDFSEFPVAKAPEKRHAVTVAILKPDGESAAVNVARLDDGRLIALAQRCTHKNCQLAMRDNGEKAPSWLCPCHGSEFDLVSGRPMGGPAKKPLAIYEVTEAAGVVRVNPKPAG